MINLFIILLIVYVVVFVYNLIKQKKLVLSAIVAFTGALGSGKTLLSVKHALSRYKLFTLFYYIRVFKERPQLISNIPIDLKKPRKMKKKEYDRRPIKDGVPVDYQIKIINGVGVTFDYKNKKVEFKSIMLEYEHFMQIYRIPEHSILLIDEIGSFASQFDYDHPIVMQDIQEFIRFFRHWIDGHVFITDQDTSQIVKAVRVRINKFYMLEDFQRYLLFFYKVNVSELKVSDDLLNVQQVNDEERPYFFGLLPFKYFTFLNKIIFPLSYKFYDSRCYSVNYRPTTEIIGQSFGPGLKTTYFLDLPQQATMKMEYKKNGYLPRNKVMQYVNDWKNRDREGN